MDMSNTIIILSADHGESFSHGYQGHAGNHLYESLVRIPLIIKMPSERKGNVINMPVSQIDIAPTILDLAGIPAPDWMEGRSLLPLVKGKSLDPRPVYSMQLIENRSFGEPITKGTIALREGDYKLIYYLKDKKSLLFDLRSDPDEMQDISQQKQDVTKRLTGLIVENLSRANTEITKSAGNNFQLIKSD
jgi:arylsulfatase A-like enzyme